MKIINKLILGLVVFTLLLSPLVSALETPYELGYGDDTYFRETTLWEQLLFSIAPGKASLLPGESTVIGVDEKASKFCEVAVLILKIYDSKGKLVMTKPYVSATVNANDELQGIKTWTCPNAGEIQNNGLSYGNWKLYSYIDCDGTNIAVSPTTDYIEIRSTTTCEEKFYDATCVGDTLWKKHQFWTGTFCSNEFIEVEDCGAKGQDCQNNKCVSCTILDWGSWSDSINQCGTRIKKDSCEKVVDTETKTCPIEEIPKEDMVAYCSKKESFAACAFDKNCVVSSPLAILKWDPKYCRPQIGAEAEGIIDKNKDGIADYITEKVISGEDFPNKVNDLTEDQMNEIREELGLSKDEKITQGDLDIFKNITGESQVCSQVNGAKCNPKNLPGTDDSGPSRECQSGWCQDVFGFGGRCASIGTFGDGKIKEGYSGDPLCLSLYPIEPKPTFDFMGWLKGTTGGIPNWVFIAGFFFLIIIVSGRRK